VSEHEVFAAGGVVVREGEGGTEIALVHRPNYDDWTIPKGKLDPGESFEDAALREVWEETGLRCSLGRELPSTEYHDRHGRFKQVRYWQMTCDEGEFEVNDEVDELRWVTPGDAAALLTYERDREVIAGY
jgi:8-oxo-dGTP diphosphatase